MKKILAVLLAISMIATMAFAADFAFSVKTSGDIVKWVEGEDFATLISRNENHSAVLAASIGDEAGATATILQSSFDGGTSDTWVFATGSIWIKPVEGVTLTFGAPSYNVGDFDGDGTPDYGKVDANGFGVELALIDGLTINFGIDQGIATNGALANMIGKVAYTLGDIATVAVTCDEELNMGAAVNGSISPVNYWVGMDKNGKDLKFGEKLDASFAIDPITLTVAEGVQLLADESIPANASIAVSYSIFSVEAAVGTDFGADKLALSTLSVTPAVNLSGNVGSAAWTLGAKAAFDLTKDAESLVTVSVPYSVSLSF